MDLQISPKNVFPVHNGYASLQAALSVFLKEKTRIGVPALSSMPLVNKFLKEHQCLAIPLGYDNSDIIPEALECACKSFRIKLVAFGPECEIPTTIQTSLQRRKDLVDVCRKYDIGILEMNWEFPGCFNPKLLPLANLAPERTIFIENSSKWISSGSAPSFAHIPLTWQDAFNQEVINMTGPFSALNAWVMNQWMINGRLDKEWEIKKMK